MTAKAAFFVGLTCATLAGCSSSHATDDAGTGGTAAGATATDGGGDEGVVTCQNDPRVLAFTANLVKSSTDGALKITIVSGDPAPPTVGTNTWVIKITDGQGAPIATTPTIDPFMPDHNHGTSIKAVATPQPDGTFSVTPLYLFMPGVWRVTFTMPSSTGVPESIAFFFCVSD